MISGCQGCQKGTGQWQKQSTRKTRRLQIPLDLVSAWRAPVECHLALLFFIILTNPLPNQGFFVREQKERIAFVFSGTDKSCPQGGLNLEWTCGDFILLVAAKSPADISFCGYRAVLMPLSAMFGPAVCLFVGFKLHPKRALLVSRV